MAIGLSYPLQLTESGGLKISKGRQLVKEHILSVLETRPGERIMRQDYGLPDFLLSYKNEIAINSKIESAIDRNCPDVEDLEIQGEYSQSGDGIYRAIVRFRGDGESESLALELEV